MGKIRQLDFNLWANNRMKIVKKSTQQEWPLRMRRFKIGCHFYVTQCSHEHICMRCLCTVKLLRATLNLAIIKSNIACDSCFGVFEKIPLASSILIRFLICRSCVTFACFLHQPVFPISIWAFQLFQHTVANGTADASEMN